MLCWLPEWMDLTSERTQPSMKSEIPDGSETKDEIDYKRAKSQRKENSTRTPLQTDQVQTHYNFSGVYLCWLGKCGAHRNPCCLSSMWREWSRHKNNNKDTAPEQHYTDLSSRRGESKQQLQSTPSKEEESSSDEHVCAMFRFIFDPHTRPYYLQEDKTEAAVWESLAPVSS